MREQERERTGGEQLAGGAPEHALAQLGVAAGTAHEQIVTPAPVFRATDSA